MLAVRPYWVKVNAPWEPPRCIDWTDVLFLQLKIEFGLLFSAHVPERWYWLEIIIINVNVISRRCSFEKAAWMPIFKKYYCTPESLSSLINRRETLCTWHELYFMNKHSSVYLICLLGPIIVVSDAEKQSLPQRGGSKQAMRRCEYWEAPKLVFRTWERVTEKNAYLRPMATTIQMLKVPEFHVLPSTHKHSHAEEKQSFFSNIQLCVVVRVAGVNIWNAK